MLKVSLRTFITLRKNIPLLVSMVHLYVKNILSQEALKKYLMYVSSIIQEQH